MSVEPAAACRHAQFPDEILDDIIQAVGPGPRCSRRRRHDFDYELKRQNWMNCSLVCRRWYQITLPYMFRRILITDVHSAEDSADGDDPFLLFLTERPSIARLVRNITFDYRMSTAVPLLMQTVAVGDIDIAHRMKNEQLDHDDGKLERLEYSTLAVPAQESLLDHSRADRQVF
ncbi:hypothetical protein BC835DRAFT_1334059 [Cytidiella melzeri]|nr:hypothetical protein BC835DRAFT_1334059 [Cytidiella melzeri]